MEYTGERLIPGKPGLEMLELEHRARYELAAQLARDKEVLDLGSGTGYGSARLAEIARSVVAVELSGEAVQFSQSFFPRPNLRFLEGDVLSPKIAERLQKLRPGGYEVVTCFELVEHLSKPDFLLDLIRNLLAPGGVTLISTPNALRHQPASERDNPYHVFEFEREAYQNLLDQYFPHVHLLQQSLHLASRISADQGEEQLHRWPEALETSPKFFVALCSDRALPKVEALDLILLTGETHLHVLRDRLGELRRDQTIRGERIEALREQASLLRARVTELEEWKQDSLAAGASVDGSQPVLDKLTEVLDELGEQRTRAKAAAAQGDLLATEWARREDQLQDLRLQLAERKATHEEQQRRIKDLKEALEAREADLEELRTALRESEASLAMARDELRHQGGQAREAQTRARALEAERKLRDERVRHLKDQIVHRTQALESIQRHLEEAQAQQEAQEEASRKLSEELQAKRARIEQLLEERDHQRQAIREIETREAQHLERIARLETTETKLEVQISRGDEQSRQEPGEETSGTDALVQRLAAELHHVLTSRRWRFAMFFVKLRNILVGRPEKSPLQAHLFDVFQHAGHSLPEALESPLAHGMPSTYVRLVCRPPHQGVDMHPLSVKEQDQWARWLQQRPEKDLVSIIMPTWNRAHVLTEAIDSVQQQSYGNWELFVVDDGSNDDTRGVVERRARKDSRIHYLHIEHRGVSAARNHGLAHASGSVIAYLDSDNVWNEHHLLFLVHAINDSGRSCAYSILRIVDQDQGDEISYRRRTYSRKALLRNNYIDINVFVHRYALYRKIGGFDPGLRRWVDWDLILRYTAEHAPAQVPVTLCDYRRRKNFKQITGEEPKAYKYKVLNKNLIDWARLEQEADHRIRDHATIIVLNYRLPDFTRKCVESILRHTRYLHYDVLIVDNGSRDQSRRILKKLARRHPQVSFMENYENYGFSLGNNLGAAASRGEYVVWLNNDIEVHEGWLTPLLSPLREDPSLGAVGPKMLYPDGTLQQGGLAFCRRSKIPYHLYQNEPGGAPHVNKRRTFQCLNGACLAVRAVDVICLQGFETLFLNGGEDLDFSFRMRFDLGKTLLYNPESSLTHYAGKSPGRSKNIMYNRRLFVELWREKIRADDFRFFAEDGFVATDYVKKGTERDGELAAYYPVLEPAESAASRSRENEQRPRQVGLVSIWYERGVSYVAKTLANALESSGNYLTHVFARWESERFHNGGSIYHPRVIDAGNDPSPEEIVTWAEDRRLDLVIFVEVHPKDWKRVKALRERGIRVLGYEHLDVLRLDMLDRYGQLDGLMSSTFHGWRALKKEFPDKPCLLIPWGISRKNVPEKLSKTRKRDGLTFVHVAGWGGLDNRKNTGLAIRAFDEAQLPQAELHVYTQAPLDQYGRDCVRIVRNHPQIHVHEGTLDDIFVAYEGADMLLWPSKREGLGLPILEALSCGLPVLISDGWMMKEWPVIGEHAVVCPAHPDAGNEKASRYLPPLNVQQDALVERLQSLARDPEVVHRMMENVHRDRAHWLWHWQKDALCRQVEWFLEGSPGPTDERRFLPQEVLQFEERRQRAREGQPEPISPTENIQYLFVAGCQRSGTTAMVFLLNADPRIVIGRERYKFCRRDIGPKHFTEQRFFDPRRKETNYRDPEFYEPLRRRWQAGGLRYVGDKVPFYYKDLPHLSDRFPDGRFLFLLRDLQGVAASYNARAANPEDSVWKESMDYRKAVENWNESLERACEYLDSGDSGRIFVVHYESFFCGDLEYLQKLYDFLELPLTGEVRSKFLEMTADWEARRQKRLDLTPEMIDYLEAHRRKDLELTVLRHAPLSVFTA